MMQRLLQPPRADRRCRPPGRGGALLGLALLLLATAIPARADEPLPEPAEPSRPRTFEVSEYRLEGCVHLTQAELEALLAPYLGPGQVLESVERARGAVERAYSDKGYQSVTVAIPRQTVRDGVVVLKVAEGTVGRLRVRGARWFSPRDIRLAAPSVAEGAVPNFNEVVRDIVALNQLPDRRITPAVRAGAEPGTVDVDLNVEETLPLHGFLELNNRQSPNTTALRLAGGLHYDNLFQRGHTLSGSFQIAPQRVKDAEVFTASYLARFAELPSLTFGLNGLVQRSDVSTLGAVAVTGRGWVVGGRVTLALPGGTELAHSLTAGLDAKRFDEGLTTGSSTIQTPIAYWPVSLQYGAGLSGEGAQTQLGATVVFNLRPLGSGPAAFDAKRYRASASFAYVRGELSRTQEVVEVGQLFGRVQGQLTDGPLLGSEGFAAGGAESVRGYREVEASGDLGVSGTLEFRSPSVTSWFGKPLVTDGRLHVFLDAARLLVRDPLPEQRQAFSLASAGGGARLRLFDHLVGSADLGIPLSTVGTTRRGTLRVHFRVVGEF